MVTISVLGWQGGTMALPIYTGRKFTVPKSTMIWRHIDDEEIKFGTRCKCWLDSSSCHIYRMKGNRGIQYEGFSTCAEGHRVLW